MMRMLYAYYGDDFTGSTDVLETLACGGVRAALFLATPTQDDVAVFPELQAVGIAGDSRSRTPEWMSAHLPELFGVLNRFGAPVTHYKTCSTFDSSPQIGSIGRAMEIGIDVFSPEFVPIVVGAPHLGRFVAFGNLFAAAGGEVYRIDRHPTMSKHPVTPMLEADLRRHLAFQTSLPIGLLDLRNLHPEGLDSVMVERPAAVLFDTVDTAPLEMVGRLIWGRARERAVFAVGSSGLTESLIPAWRLEGLIGEAPAPIAAQPVEQIVVLSGSCSPVTQGQIEWALANGFHGIRVDPTALIRDSTGPLAEAMDCLRVGGSPVLYTALGPLEGTVAHSAKLGIAFGQLLKGLIANSSARRVVLCGGDTSSHAMQQLPIRALSWAAPLALGAPLCRAHAPGTIFDGLELALKGGQVGQVDFFRRALGRRALIVATPHRVS